MLTILFDFFTYFANANFLVANIIRKGEKLNRCQKKCITSFNPSFQLSKVTHQYSHFIKLNRHLSINIRPTHSCGNTKPLVPLFDLHFHHERIARNCVVLHCCDSSQTVSMKSDGIRKKEILPTGFFHLTPSTPAKKNTAPAIILHRTGLIRAINHCKH